MKYTYYGDTDLNGVVDFDDYSHTDNGFNSGGTDWFHGDFDYNNKVNGDDYFAIDSHVDQSGTVFGYSNGDLNFDGVINGDDYFSLDSNTPARRRPRTRGTSSNS